MEQRCKLAVRIQGCDEYGYRVVLTVPTAWLDQFDFGSSFAPNLCSHPPDRFWGEGLEEDRVDGGYRNRTMILLLPSQQKVDSLLGKIDDEIAVLEAILQRPDYRQVMFHRDLRIVKRRNYNDEANTNTATEESEA